MRTGLHTTVLASVFLSLCHSTGLAATGEISVLPMAPGDSTPFVVRLTAQGLGPDSTYEFAVWVYGGSSPISRRWAFGDWEYGAYYEPFSSDSAGNWATWAFLRVIRPPDPGYDYYIKCRVRDGSGMLFEDIVAHSQGFQILDMSFEGGWLEGIVYSDPECQSPYERVVLLARGPSDSIVGGYLSEDNLIEEGNRPDSGYFYTGVKAGEVSRFDCLGLEADTVAGYFERPPPWVVRAGETTFISVTQDLSVLSPILFIPEEPGPGADLQVKAKVFNRGNSEATSFRVFCFRDKNYNREQDEGEQVDEEAEGELAPQETLEVSLWWNDIPEGIHFVFVRVEVDGDEHPENDMSCRSLRVGNPIGDLVLNELMYHPLTGEPEWIEVKNRSPYEVPLENWTIEDGDSLDPRPFSLTSVPSQGFFLLVSDSAHFRALHPEVACPFLMSEGGLPSLNDTGDRITLRNSDGVVIDRVEYQAGWGGRRGVSLERINPNLASQNPSNWSSCVSYQGATPGRENSIYVELPPAKGSLSCAPKVFSPDGDGFGDRVAVSYQLPFTKARVRLQVYDRAGRLVKALLDQEESAARSTVFWDGKDEDGRVLPIGVYIVYLEAVQGRDLITAKKSCVLAKKLR